MWWGVEKEQNEKDDENEDLLHPQKKETWKRFQVKCPHLAVIINTHFTTAFAALKPWVIKIS